MAAPKRFAQTTSEQMENKRLTVNSENTLRCSAKAANILRDYLKEQGQNEDFEGCDAVSLAEILGHFYCDARKPDGGKYKTSSFENIRHSLNRYLRSPPFNKLYDIIKDPEFADANQNYMYKSVIAELKREGLGTITHHAAISESDRQKLYTSIHLSPTTPCGLLNKVQFDIRLYFFRRGCENMHTMTKDTFVVKQDPKSGQKFVTKKIDEMTKNHRENDKENITPIMPEIPDSAYCPVTSYELYISKLHPDLDRLWQRPLSIFLENDDVWYAKVPVGQKTLGVFMSELSKSCELSQVYTNHSIRATEATVLSKGMFGPAQIMAVTGHKSVQSLSVYQRVDDDEKLQMGKTLSESLVPTRKNQLALPSSNTVRPAIQSASSLPLALTSAEDQLAGVDIGALFDDFVPSNSMSNTTNMKASQTNPTIFNNCTFTINFKM